MFVGRFEHTLDSNGRLILPRDFRTRLADGAFITPLDNCLAILPADEFDQMAANLEIDVGRGLVDVNALRAFASQADHVVPDGQGRMRILPHLREAAGLERNVIVTGALRRVEIWDAERWADLQVQGIESLAQAITHGRGISNA